MTASRVATITIGEFVANHWHGPCDLTIVRHATRRWRDGQPIEEDATP